MSKQRYERRPSGDLTENKMGTNTAVEGGEIVTGIPITESTTAGSPQYAAYQEAAQEAASNASRVTDSQPIEDRDRRGSDETDGNGKIKSRVPITEVEEMASEMAGGFANSVEQVRSELDGDRLTVSITTRHGTSKESAEVKDWSSKASIKAALSEIKDKMEGKTSSSSSEPKDKLAEAVREIAAGSRA